jgi:plasmid replication initiation protein
MNKSMTATQDFKLVNSRYKLNASESKFILAAIAQIDSKQDDVLKEYEIKVSDLEAKLQSEQNVTRLKHFAKKLMSKPLEIPTKEGFLIFNWFSKIRYYHDERLFRVRIEEDLKPYLLQLRDRFVAVNLKYVLQFESQYSIRIYQLLKEYEKLKKRYFNVEELQDLLQVPKSYRRYDNFKRKVLEVAEKEINEHTDLFITIEEEKKGRKVNRLIFRISTKVKDTQNNDKHDFSEYLKTKIYINDDWQTIVKIVADQENDKYIYIDVVDEKFDLTTHHLHIEHLKQMREYAKSKNL